MAHGIRLIPDSLILSTAVARPGFDASGTLLAAVARSDEEATYRCCPDHPGLPGLCRGARDQPWSRHHRSLGRASYPAPCAPDTAGASVSVSGNGPLSISGARVGSGPSVAIYSDASNAAAFDVTGSGKAELTGSADVPSMAVSVSGSSPLKISKGVLVSASVQARRTLYVAGERDDVVAVDAASGKLGTPLDVGKPFDLAITPSGKTLYVLDFSA
ncbi:MAG TPA: hypothetical protein VFN61_12520 [Acidimicrobiales bacterium]|nr:hypothetical protein [Acidimicrobiales bacterium]